MINDKNIMKMITKKMKSKTKEKSRKNNFMNFAHTKFEVVRDIKEKLKKKFLKKLSILIFALLIVLNLKVTAKAENRIVYNINQITLTSYQVTLKWSGIDAGNIQVVACNKQDDNTAEIHYNTNTNFNVRTVTIDTTDLNMNLTQNKPNIILKDQNGNEKTLADIPGEGEMKTAIQNLYSQGIINGYDDNTFKPNNSITKEEFCSMFFNMMGYKVDEAIESKFGDLPNNRWSKNLIMTLNKIGIITGQDDGNVGILKNVTLSEVATMVSKAKNLKLIPGNFEMTHINVEHWANEYISKMFTNKIIKSSDAFYSATCQNTNLTRGQVALILNRV